MTGQNRKSYKKDAEYLKQRVTELVDENDKLQVQIRNLQSPKSPSVADENSKLENAKNSNGNAGVANSEKSASSEKEGQKVPYIQMGQSMGKTDTSLIKTQPQAPQEQKNILQIEEPEPAETPEPKEKPEEFTFECPECSKQFNELNNGCCPYCDAELEENAD